MGFFDDLQQNSGYLKWVEAKSDTCWEWELFSATARREDDSSVDLKYLEMIEVESKQRGITLGE